MSMSGNIDTITAVIIAGGKSRRFGTDKALYPFEGRPLIEHAAAVLRRIFTHVIISTNDIAKFSYLGLPCFADTIPGIGPLGGIYTALSTARTHYIFTAACDMPNLNEGLIRDMASLAHSYDIVIPRTKDGYEALHAIYSRACLPHIQRTIEAGRRRIVDFFEDVSIRHIEEDEIRQFGDPSRIFFNINYSDDLRRA